MHLELTDLTGDLNNKRTTQIITQLHKDGLSRNFGLAKILVWGTKIPGKFGPLDYYFLVRAWNNGPSANTSV